MQLFSEIKHILNSHHQIVIISTTVTFAKDFESARIALHKLNCNRQILHFIIDYISMNDSLQRQKY